MDHLASLNAVICSTSGDLVSRCRSFPPLQPKRRMFDYAIRHVVSPSQRDHRPLPPPEVQLDHQVATVTRHPPAAGHSFAAAALPPPRLSPLGRELALPCKVALLSSCVRHRHDYGGPRPQVLK